MHGTLGPGVEGPMELARLVADGLLAATGDAIVATDRDGTLWNAGAERIFGHPAAEAIGRSST